MNPLSLLTLGTTAFSLFQQASGNSTQQQGYQTQQQAATMQAQAQAKFNTQQAQFEQQIEEQRRQAMRLDASRKSMEDFRQANRANALAVSAAANSGAERSSGLAGGKAQVLANSGWNQAGIAQNLQIGENIFGINSNLSAAKIDYAQTMGQAGTLMAQGQGMVAAGGGRSQMGKAVGGLGEPLGKIFSSLPSLFNPS